jgi:hypothetical protein
MENNMHEVQLELFSDPPLPLKHNEHNERIDYLEYIITQIGLKVRTYQETRIDSVLEVIPSYIDDYFSKYN